MTATATPPVTLPAEPLGPGGIVWYAAGDQRALLLAVRLLLHQVAHPMVGAGVEQQSVYKTDPYGRLWRTTQSVVRSVYGGRAAAEEGQRLLRMHASIRGTDAQGRSYHALNPQAYAWVHWTAYEGTRLFLRDFGPGLTDEQDQQLFEEWQRLGLLIGVRPDQLPETREEFWAGWREQLPRLENNPVVQDILYAAPRAPRWLPVPRRWADAALQRLASPMLALQRDVIAATLDPDFRARIGLPAPSRRTRRRVAGLRLVSRLGNGLPEPVRLAPLALLRGRRTRRDGTTRPEPVPYP
ncbi:oxygenase MpaB family protein [Nocardioides panacisoli]|uniref:ER-bound oxygenase mpaB/mpaB'/Rubber oxygenase catalytic domain-containing protein n=1 Tax=Nocardioides panacisoli TaxID=627624 RepID=A0ABP7I5I5_9ACTN